MFEKRENWCILIYYLMPLCTTLIFAMASIPLKKTITHTNFEKKGRGGWVTHQARIVKFLVAFCPELLELSNAAVRIKR